MNLAEQNNSISTREDFIAFVKALQNDFQNNPQSWENDNLKSFLEALGAWVKDMDGYYLNQGKPVPQEPTWKMLGDILLASKMYE